MNPMNRIVETMERISRIFHRKAIWVVTELIALGIVAAWGYQAVLAHQQVAPAEQVSSFHPTFEMLDAEGVSVLASGAAVSPVTTCGACHDAAFIRDSSHPAHRGLDDRVYATWNPGVAADKDQVVAEEMNCFLCHIPAPDNAARLDAIRAGESDWAATATLLGSGIVAQAGDGYRWNPQVFDEEGLLLPEYVLLQDPTSENCGACHGVVQMSLSEALVVNPCDEAPFPEGITGEVFSPQRIADSGLNLANKASLTRTWDVHAERLLQCTDCHHAPNNPIFALKDGETTPDHLTFDPRRLGIGEYLERPIHRFSGGPEAGEAASAGMRRCADCHNATDTHTWLPYADRHMQALQCETCHIPQAYTPAFSQYDWTVVNQDGSPKVECRGGDRETRLITGYVPALLPGATGGLTPTNLAGAWYWVAGNPSEPIDLEVLQAAYLDGEGYHPVVLAALDLDGDGVLDGAELALDTPEKTALIASRLAEMGLQNPQIAGEVQNYRLHHSVTGGDWALRDCRACHNAESRITQPLQLAAYLPGGVEPGFPPGSNLPERGTLYQEQGALFYRPASVEAGLYVLGHDRVAWIDLLGGLAFVGTLAGVAAHGSFRFFAILRRPRHTPRLKRVYMYAVYERFWHWLQTFTILGLIFTGLVIHRPDVFGIFNFSSVVLVHNVLAAILVVNAGLSLFYHLASGEIRQYIPRPAGFFDQAIVQTQYYLRGIFQGDGHPFEKTPAKKLNPLQQATYFAILNVLLPLQILTGIFMWGAQHWPTLTARLGGLPFLAPFHSLVAWLFASFVVLHVYLTTTGHRPMAAIQAMMVGWDEVEEPHDEGAGEHAEEPFQEEAISGDEEELELMPVAIAVEADESDVKQGTPAADDGRFPGEQIIAEHETIATPDDGRPAKEAE
jgi:thiosulfate reductase cytochrome b subunit